MRRYCERVWRARRDWRPTSRQRWVWPRTWSTLRIESNIDGDNFVALWFDEANKNVIDKKSKHVQTVTTMLNTQKNRATTSETMIFSYSTTSIILPETSASENAFVAVIIDVMLLPVHIGLCTKDAEWSTITARVAKFGCFFTFDGAGCTTILNARRSNNICCLHTKPQHVLSHPTTTSWRRRAFVIHLVASGDRAERDKARARQLPSLDDERASDLGAESLYFALPMRDGIDLWWGGLLNV